MPLFIMGQSDEMASEIGSAREMKRYVASGWAASHGELGGVGGGEEEVDKQSAGGRISLMHPQ
jgi:hypothetical protein